MNLSKLWPYLREKLKVERTYILPTKLGIYYAALCLMLLAVAFIYGNNINYFACFILSSLGIVTMFQTNFNLHRIKIKILPLAESHAEQPCTLKILLENNSSLPSYHIQIRLEPYKKNQTIKDLSQEIITVPLIGPHQKVEVEFSLIYTSRGYQNPPTVIAETTFPLGLLRSWKWMRTQETFIIYPARQGKLPLPHLGIDGAEDLFHKESHLQADQEFMGHRPYQSSDSLRKVDWKAYARTQKLNIKLFEGEEKGSLLLTWDSTQSLKDVESRISQLTQWVSLCQRKKLDFILELPGWKSTLGHSINQVHECYQALALFKGAP